MYLSFNRPIEENFEFSCIKKTKDCFFYEYRTHRNTVISVIKICQTKEVKSERNNEE